MEEVKTENTRNEDSSKHLIKLIKEHPILWNRTHELYKNKDAREKAWFDICRNMDPHYEKLDVDERNQLVTHYTKKWYNIRDSYRRSFSVKSRNRPYIYSDALGFMDTSFRGKKNIEEHNSSDQDETDPTSSEVFVDTNYIHDRMIDSDVEREAKRLKLDEVVKKEISNNLQNDIVTVLSNVINKAEDEETSFFRSITSSVKSLSNESKLEFKIEVLKLIKKLKAKDEDGPKMEPEYLEESD